MKFPQFTKLPAFLPKKKNKKLEATARRVARDGSDELDEPNMKLSSAFVIVLALHVVAVGGVYAFSSIKSHRAPAVDSSYRPPVKTAVAADKPGAAAAPAKIEQAALTTTQPPSGQRTHRVKQGETVARIAADNRVSVDDLEEANGLKNVNALRIGQEIKIPSPSTEPAKAVERKPAGSPAKASAMVRDSGETYTVAKGDNPVAIARKHGINYDELLKLNKIDDPKKLKVGAKLRLPSKPKAKP